MTHFAQQPFVTIRWVYNSELGAFVPLSEPKEIPRREYEEESSPALCANLKEDVERLETLCQKLEEMNQPGGKADELTLKLLIDAMIRQAPLLITHPEHFATDYTDWVELRSGLVWVAVEDWAIKRGFAPETLAADNILFNIRLVAEQNIVFVQPMVMIDLHDFVICIDGPQGLMQVLPTGNTPTLRETFIPSQESGISDLKELYNDFCTRVAELPWLHKETAQREEMIGAKIYSDPKIGALVKLEKAKKLLFKGNAQRAVEVLDTIGETDLAPIVFWGAVAHQYLFFKNYLQETDLLTWETDLLQIDALLRRAYGHGFKELGTTYGFLLLSIWTLQQ